MASPCRNIEQECESYIADALQYMDNNPLCIYRIFAENIINSFIVSYLDKTKGKGRADKFVSGLLEKLEDMRTKITKLQEVSL